MNLENSTQKSPSIQNLCGISLGDSGHFSCERESNHGGVHVHYKFASHYPVMYRDDDPTQFAHSHCHTCLVPITDANRGSGTASALYCIDHLGPVQEAHRIANSCKACGFPGPHRMRNYSMMWHEADIHCGSCDKFLRYWDAG